MFDVMIECLRCKNDIQLRDFDRILTHVAKPSEERDPQPVLTAGSDASSCAVVVQRKRRERPNPCGDDACIPPWKNLSASAERSSRRADQEMGRPYRPKNDGSV